MHTYMRDCPGGEDTDAASASAAAAGGVGFAPVCCVVCIVLYAVCVCVGDTRIDLHPSEE